MPNEVHKRSDGKYVCTHRVQAYVGSTRCGNTAKFDPVDGKPTRCGHHSAAAFARREEQQKAKVDADLQRWRSQQAARDARAAVNEHLKTGATLLAEIADDSALPRLAAADWTAEHRRLEEEARAAAEAAKGAQK